MDSRPPPPPHGSTPTGGPNASTNNAYSKSTHLPPGNYDIFVIPPHSAGSGFLYLPSMQPHRNSFLAGVACTLMVVAVWATVIPAIKSWLSSVAASGGVAVLFLVLAVGVLGWAAGKTQSENAGPGTGGPAGTGGGHQQSNGYSWGFPPGGSTPFNAAGGGTGSGPTGAGSKPFWQKPPPPPAGAGAASWEKAREETRKREEQRRKQEESERDKTRAREKEAREKAARERVAQERQRKETEAKSAAKEKESAKPQTTPAPNTSKTYQKPTAQSFAGDDEDDNDGGHGAYSYRPYDNPKKHKQDNSNSSHVSASTWAPSGSTAKTTPPPSRRGPYSNKDPDKIAIRAVYAFHDQLVKPVAQLVSGLGSITDGLILRMSSEGLFIDDDVRGVGQREWDVKAWTLKLVETGDLKGKHVLRVTTREAENKKYVFIIDAAESWKVAMGLQRLRRGTQVRSLGVSGLPTSETKALLLSLGWLRE